MLSRIQDHFRRSGELYAQGLSYALIPAAALHVMFRTVYLFPQRHTIVGWGLYALLNIVILVGSITLFRFAELRYGHACDQYLNTLARSACGTIGISASFALHLLTAWEPVYWPPAPA